MTARLGPSMSAAMAALEEKDATSQLRLQFRNDIVTQPGTSVTPATAQEAPELALASKLSLGSGKYLSVSIDIDAPFPSFPVLSPILHGLQSDLTTIPSATSADGDGNSDGWTQLVTDVAPIVAYIPPNPPPPSAAHRYLFVVWGQPAGLDAAGIRKALGLAETMGRWARTRWDGQIFEQALGLGSAVAANYFLSSK